ncbi:MAG: hypothetical protein AAF799_13050 [Myxococcota bacterium]
MSLAQACYRGGERDKDPPPGLPGGLCLAPDGSCAEGQCNLESNFCYDPADPCRGFFCGGDERGMCFTDPATFLPTCSCAVGYNNDQFALYCCPDPALGVIDPNCSASPGGEAGAEDDGDEPMTDEGGSGEGDGSTG